MVDKTRRNYIFAGLGLGAVLAAAGLRPGDKGAAHQPYFNRLSNALDGAGAAQPSLVVDKTLMLENVKTLRGHIGKRFDFRIVAKSLPAIGLLKAIMAAAGTERLMLFHQPFANQIAEQIPNADILFGKPMPVAAARNFYRALRGDFKPERQLQWLVDSPERLAQYDALAKNIGQPMRINIELDVGLHRGGVDSGTVLQQMLATIKASEFLSFSGLMGYEPHVAKVPGNTIGHRDQAMAKYRQLLDVAVNVYGGLDPDWVLNAAGSPTYQLYDEGEFPHNEISAGSCLVKPTDFDMATLADHRPASYIATPVIKALSSTQLPGVAALGKLMSWWNPNRRKAFFTYGGYWKAQPESPGGLSNNPIYGRSSNQEMLNGSDSVELQADDWVFLRPSQSEFVFLQFGDILVYQDDKIIERWPVMAQQV